MWDAQGGMLITGLTDANLIEANFTTILAALNGYGITAASTTQLLSPPQHHNAFQIVLLRTGLHYPHIV
jgi:hypothetical protein